MSKTTLQFTPLEEIPKIRDALKAGHRSGKLLPIEYRKNQLLQLAYLLQENNTRFEEAFAIDLGRHVVEASLLELNGTLGEVLEAHKKCSSWAKPEGVPFDLQFSAMRPTIYKVPKGVALIIGPFNYPITCSIAILAGAIAAGCPAVVKMSELTPTISSLVAELFPKYMDQDLYRIVNGGVPETTALLDLQWDHIVFTGSGNVGKVVASAAAKHLTPVTLELGGQCPVIVDPKTDFATAARRILWGKTINVGQTCLAPNHILVPADAQDAFVEALTKAYDTFYPDGAAKSDSVSRIVSDNHFNRLKAVLDRTQGEIVRGGDTDAATKFIAPTIVKNVKPEDSLMEAELFGPILPIVPVKDLQEAIDFTNARAHPLALYLFSEDSKLKKTVTDATQSGAISFNEVCVHMAVPGLPFGGTGPSGYGYHTGKYSFGTFTHFRSSLDSPRWVDYVFAFRFPPYTMGKYKQANLTKSSIPYPRPGPGIAPIQKRTGILSWVRRPFFVGLGVAIFILTLRHGLGYDSLPAAILGRFVR